MFACARTNPPHQTSSARLLTLLALLASAPLSAQTAGKTDQGKSEKMPVQMDMQEEATGWKELDAFHQIMMATWHPARGQNNLVPIKAKAGDLSAAAQKWKASKAPKGCDSPQMKDAVVKVAAGAQDLAALVKKGTDDTTLKSSLAGVHENFEVVEMGCKPVKALNKKPSSQKSLI